MEVSRSGTGQGLKGVRQRECTIPNYSIDVHTRASQSSWNSFALMDAFLHGLSDYVVSFVSFHGAHYLDLHVQVPRREIHQMVSPHRTAAQIRGGFSGSLSSSTSQVVEPEPTMLFQSPYVLWGGGFLHHHVSNKSQGSSIIMELWVSPTSLSPQIKRQTGRHLLSTFATPSSLCHLVSPKVSE